MITESDLRWAYQFYVGRAPDGPDAVAYFMSNYGGSALQLQRAFLETPEMLGQQALPASAARFCVWRPGRPRVVVAGHCLATNLARAVAAIADVSVFGFDPVNFTHDPDEILPYLDDADLLLMPHMREEWAPFDTAGLRERHGRKTLFFSMPVFEGVHPDLTYLGHRGERFDSPVGELHSRVAVGCFLDGVSAEDCAHSYIDRVLALRPREIWDRSRAELVRREAEMDLPLAPWFFRTVRKRPLMYTTNHVTSEVTAEIARQGLRRFGADCLPTPAPLIQSSLASSVIWPVYPAVARLLRLGYVTAPVIQANHYTMPISEFVVRSYDLYERSDRARLEETARARGLI